MSAYPPPTENVPVFNSVYYTSAVPTATINSLSKYFLNFPVAQGTEYFNNASFSNAPVCSAIQNYPSSATSNLATIGYVNNATSGRTYDVSFVPIEPVSNNITLNSLVDFLIIGNYNNGGSAWANAWRVLLPYSPTLYIPSGYQITIRNNTGFVYVSGANEGFAVNFNATQSIFSNSSTTAYNPANGDIKIANGSSTTLVFQNTVGTTGCVGFWYIIGV